ncbi:unnamed protein product [Didymodactylos carnosus]|uniref:Uncharacterized protein n=1 Tax=Didymodactylos carnosus TaxID=1234261 RepID=A0A8S2FLU7_9BILA|nr:unnamed protein product [Didymodactylos carnosus]CAF4296309.1 unnamed protein product [Didymodactylos carnosus]
MKTYTLHRRLSHAGETWIMFTLITLSTEQWYSENAETHRLNLVTNDTYKVVPYMWDYFLIVSNIHSFFTDSGVTSTFFKQAQQQLGLVRSSTLKLWAETKWDSRWQAIDAIVNNYPAIIKALADISEEGSGTRSTNAGERLMHAKKSIFIITLFILHQLFGLIKVLSDHLKNPALDYVRGEHLVISIIQQISNLRNEPSFNQIYDKAKKFCDVNGIGLVQQCQIHRKIKIPATFNDCFINSTLGQCPKLSTSTHFMNQIYFPLIDCMLVKLNHRFSFKTLSFMTSMLVEYVATVYPESKQFLNIDDVDESSRHIDVDSSALTIEFTVIKSMLIPKTIIDVIQLLNELV